MKSLFFAFIKSIFGIVFSLIIAIILFFGGISYYRKTEFLLSNGTIIGIVFFMIMLILGLYFWVKKNPSLNGYDSLNLDKLVPITTIVLFFGQCYVFYNIFFLSGWDTIAVRSFADTILNDGDTANLSTYFSIYPNNLLISYVFLALRKLNSYFGIFAGEYSYMCVVVLNCTINACSCWLSYKIARVFTTPIYAFLAYILCVFSIGISGWSAVGYSDALALIFPVLSVYLYCKQYKSAKTETAGFLTSGMLSAIGYFIKPQCVFVLLAMIAIEIIRLLSKFSWNALIRSIAVCLVAAVAFAVINTEVNALNQKYNICIDESRELGATHFLMMGANEAYGGGYSGEDVSFSSSFSTVQERKMANLQVFKERISTMKGGLLQHLRNKMLTTFNDGTFAWTKEGDFFLVVPGNINSKMSPFLKSIYHQGNRVLPFATFQHCVWLFILACSLLSVLSKETGNHRERISLIWIILLGFVFYEMLFEVRARYVYIFVPLFCALAPVGMRSITEIAEKIYFSYRKACRKDNKQ